MGELSSKDLCPLTGLEAKVEKYDHCTSYTIKLLADEITYFVCNSCQLSFKPKNYFLFKGLIANGIFKNRSFLKGNDCNNTPPNNSFSINLNDYLNLVHMPKYPNQKSDNLLKLLFDKQYYDGSTLILNEKILEELTIKGYFKNDNELDFYFRSLDKRNYISYVFMENFQEFSVLGLTLDGIQKIIELNENGDHSNFCFIAMAFNREMDAYRNAIIKAVKNSNYEPIIIDEIHINSDKTIPDEILNSIKKSKFCIADFTHHRNGVYFEAGYALGLGKSVIYCCHNDQFNESHFDIKQLQHIIYKNENDLEERLFQKIEAWIK